MDRRERNLQRVQRWADLYNDGGSKFVSECYIEDVTVDCPGALLIRGREAFTAIEDAVCAAAPKRWFRIDRTIADGDVVMVQATLFDPDQGDDFSTRFCAVLTFDDDGLVVNDTTYLDAARWPMPADVAERVDGLNVEWKVPAPA
ncbi:MAG TPA: nuclear transport factor 2 family protein [Pseudonocardia sp.]|jgi:ketosteroid isomerase-like protein